MPTQHSQPVEHSLNIRKPYFDLIASGTKTIKVTAIQRSQRSIVTVIERASTACSPTQRSHTACRCSCLSMVEARGRPISITQ